MTETQTPEASSDSVGVTTTVPASDLIEAGVSPNPYYDAPFDNPPLPTPEVASEDMTGEDAREAEKVAAARVDAARVELDEAVAAHKLCLRAKATLDKPLTLAEINEIQRRVNRNEQKARQAPINYAQSRGMVLSPAPVSGRRAPLVDPNKGNK